MKILGWVALALLSAHAVAHQHHAKHNMVLVGESEIFASHLVYKVPHNYQVILKVNFSSEVRAKYLAARQGNPQGLMIFLLDPMDISKIASATSIAGTLISETPDGKRTELEAGIRIEKEKFQLLYFDEVPLSLGS